MGSLRAECPKGDTDFVCCPKLRRARENSAEAMMQIERLPEGDSQRFAGVYYLVVEYRSVRSGKWLILARLCFFIQS